MAGLDCEFVEKPPEVIQTHCPVCLLVLCEPHQAECCGKSFCNECISKIKARNQPCPTCNQKDFVCYQNLGLQQPLYGFRVFCSNKESGCAWEGELGQLDQHINSNPDKEKQLVGCGYTNVSCVYCEGQHQRQKMEEHQASLCVKRPFTCSLCEEYKSTYNDVMNSHTPVCKCRPVKCPNSCGADNLQHQHLKEHVSSQCPLTLVECEFSEAGCAAKVYRKDLPSHLTDNIVTHMSLLAKENRKLKLRLKEQQVQLKEQQIRIEEQQVQFEEQGEVLKKTRKTMEEENRKLKIQLMEIKKVFVAQNGQIQQLSEAAKVSARVPPFDFVCPARVIQEGGTWSSEIFRSADGYILQLHVKIVETACSASPNYLDVCFQDHNEPSLHDEHPVRVTVMVVDQQDGSQSLKLFKFPVEGVYFTRRIGQSRRSRQTMKMRYVKNGHLLFRVIELDWHKY